jgi:phosphatidate cytidylyltransferase
LAFAELKSRAIVTVIGAPLVIFCVMIGKIPFMLFFTFVLIASLWEFYKMAHEKGAFPDSILSIFTALLLLWDMYFYWAEHFLIILTLYVVVISILQLRQENGSQIINLSSNLWGVVFLGVLISFFIAIRQLPVEFGLPYIQGGYWALIILLTIWIGDSVAYFVGSSIGKHKLAKRVSPKKTIEGAVGGFFSMILMSIVFKYIFPVSWSLLDAIIIGLICGTIGQISDLVESQFKRDAGIKDSSNILPGHGGIFDRFDVLFLTPPVLYFYLKYFSSFV